MINVLFGLLLAGGVTNVWSESAMNDETGTSGDSDVTLHPTSKSIESDGTYYLYNIGAKRWMGFGGKDGYQAAFLDYGCPLTLTKTEGGYHIGNTHYDSNAYLSATGAGRSSASLFIIEEAEEGIYTIKSDNGYFGYAPESASSLKSQTVVATDLGDGGNENAYWMLMTRADLEARLESASATNPVDATFYISCPGFNRHEVGIQTDWNGFTYANSYYNPNQTGFHISGSTGSTFEGQQTLKGLRAGKYRLSCSGFYRAGTNTEAYNSYANGTYPYNAELYAGERSAPLMSIYEDGQESEDIYNTGKATNTSWTWTCTTTKGGKVYPYFSSGNTYPNSAANVAIDNGLYTPREGFNQLEFTVTDGEEINIGVRTTNSRAYDWTAVDNFRLEYMGTVTEDDKEEILSGATYYIYNVGADLWMDFGGKDNYTLALKPHGAPFRMTQNTDGTWTLNAPMSDKPYISATGVAGSSKGAFTLERQSDGSYTILVENKYLGYGGTKSDLLSQTVVDVKLKENADDNTHWLFLSKSELVARLEQASKENPVDATFYIDEPNFNRHGAKLQSWTNHHTGWCGGYLYNNCGWNVNEVVTVSQKLTGLKPGSYTLRAQAVYSYGTSESVVRNYTAETMPVCGYLFAGGSKEKVMGVLDESAGSGVIVEGVKTTDGQYIPALTATNTNGAVSAFDNGMYGNNEVHFVVGDDCSATIGIKVTQTTAGAWIAYDNFTLDYNGPVNPMDYINIDLTKDEYAALCLPFNITPDLYGPTYRIAKITEEKAVLVAADAIPAGTPCVVFVTGEKPELTLEELQERGLNISAPDAVIALWDNTLLEGEYGSCSWTATLANGTEIEGKELDFEVVDTENLNVECTVENRAIERYLNEVTYTSSSNTSLVYGYNEAPPARRDQPKSFTLPLSDGKEYVIENMIPGKTYVIDYTDTHNKHYAGTVTATGNLRMINAESVHNIRDLGGWTTEQGYKVRYGKIYRGGALNGKYTTATADDIKKLEDLGIGAEIDLRWYDGYDKDDQVGISAFGFVEGETFYCARANDFLADHLSDAGTQKRLKEEFMFTLQNLTEDRAVYFHCAWGADRTGMLAFLLEGLLGMSVNDMYLDYELTSFSNAGNRVFTSLKERLDVIQAQNGTTLADKFETYFTEKLGVKKDDIEKYRELMLEGYVPTPDNIRGVYTQPESKKDIIYDLGGRQLPTLQRGINIINGKKVLY